MQWIAYFRAAMARFFVDERAQDTFEYVLIIGAVVVAVILAVTTPIGNNLIKGIVGGVCTAVKGISNMGGVTC